jgi:hypothetical protein
MSSSSDDSDSSLSGDDSADSQNQPQNPISSPSNTQPNSTQLNISYNSNLQQQESSQQINPQHSASPQRLSSQQQSPPSQMPSQHITSNPHQDQQFIQPFPSFIPQVLSELDNIRRHMEQMERNNNNLVNNINNVSNNNNIASNNTDDGNFNINNNIPTRSSEYSSARRYCPISSSKLGKMPKPLKLISPRSSFRDHELLNANPFQVPRLDLSRILLELDQVYCPWPVSLPDSEIFRHKDNDNNFMLNVINRQYTFSRNMFKMVFDLALHSSFANDETWIFFEKLLLLIQDNAHELRRFKEEALSKGTEFEEAFRLTYEKPHNEASNRLTMCQLATLNSNRSRNRTFNSQSRSSRQSRRPLVRFPNELNVGYLFQDSPAIPPVLPPTYPSIYPPMYNPKFAAQASHRSNGGSREKVITSWSANL